MDRTFSFTQHLEELRKRIIKSAAVILAASCIVYSFIDKIFSVLIRPVGKLVFIAPQEAFLANIKIAIWGGLFLASPFVIYEIWEFISAGLKPDEKKYILIFGPFSFFLFVAGALFGFFLIVPIGMKLLLGFANEFVIPMITVNSYISFVGGLVFAFGIVFELPLVMIFLTKTGIITPEFLSQKRRHAIVLIFIVAAVLTPPDVISQCLMAIPLLVLYELGVIGSKISKKRCGV